MNNKTNLKESNIYIKLLFYSFSIIPITFLIGNFAINLIPIIICCIFLIGIISNNLKFEMKDRVFYLLIFLFISLLINLYFSNNFYLTLPRTLKFIIIIFFVISFKHLLNFIEDKEIIKLYKIWFIIIIFVVFDLIYEFFIGHNIFGQTGVGMPGRLSSFTGKEMVIGHFFSAFVLFGLAYVYRNYENKMFNIFLALFFILISFLIGERSNFVKTFIIIFIFIFLIYEFKLKYKLIFFSFIFLIFALILNSNNYYKLRYYDQVKNLFQKDGIKLYLNNSVYGAHYKVAIKIFNNYPIFGVGIKNFRVESFDDKYQGIFDSTDENSNSKPDVKVSYSGWTGGSTHPHQIHFELLSETGLFGYISFLIFIFLSFYLSIKTYLSEKNIYQFCGMLFVFVNLLPLLPSGSFFSTYTAGLFWINYSIMVGYIKK
mgnify:CR=1 FL=1